MQRGRSRPFIPIAQLLGNDEQLAPLVERATRLRHLQEHLNRIAPVELARRCRVASLREGTVVVRAADNATAAKLRVLLPRLLDGFLAAGVHIKGLKIEVQFLTEPMNGTGRTPKTMAKPPSLALDRLADQMPDSRLRDALMSLSRKGRPV